jgi:hypothetical protein
MRVGVARNDERRRLVTALVLLLGAGGCSIPTRVTAANPEIGRKMTPVVIDEGLTKMDEAETKRRIERMMASPEMKAVEQELIAGLVDGSLSALGDEERSARISELTTQYMRRVAQSAVRGALDGAMTEEHQRDLRRFAGSLMAASVGQLKQSLDEANLGRSVSSALNEHVGPAMETVLRENLGPAAAALLGNEELTRALGATARTIGREMVLGAHEALAEIQEKSAPSDGTSLLSRLGSLTRKGTQLVSTLTWAVGAVAIALAVWVVRLLVQRRRYSTESEARAMTTRLLTEAIKASEGKPWSDELIQALEERFRAEEEAVLHLHRARRKLERERQEPPRPGHGDNPKPRPSLA